MRLLWTRFGKSGTGFADDRVQALCEEASGVELGAFFDRHVRGHEEVDAERILRTVGLQLEPDEGDDDENKREPWLGITTREDGDALMVATALDGGPAVQAGLYANDQLLALDGFRVDAASLKDRLAPLRAGDQARFTIFRRDELREVAVTLGEKPADKFKITPAAGASDADKAAYRAWLGEEWKPAEE
jgi:predicted metalloprotease with PDZ domain